MKNWVCWGGVHRKSNQYEGRTKLKQWVWYWLCWLRLWRCIVGSEYVSGETYLEIINTPVAIGMAEMVHGEWAEEQQSSSKIGLRKTSNEGWMTEWNKMRNLLTPLIKRKLYSWDTVLKQMKRRRTGKIISNVGKRFIRNFCQLRKRLNTSAKSLQSFPWPHGLQPTRLPHPWDSPGKSTGVGCHFLLQCMKVKNESEVAQLCPTLSDPMDCSLPGSSVHGILLARVLEWGAIAFSDNPKEKWAKSMKRQFTEQERQMSFKHRKRVSTPLMRNATRN